MRPKVPRLPYSYPAPIIGPIEPGQGHTRPRAGWVDWDDQPPQPMLGAVLDLEAEKPPGTDALWVPDAERGGWKQQHVAVPTKPRLGFRP